jgi:3-oxoacyl-[acyl-carrier protein] reductase
MRWDSEFHVTAFHDMIVFITGGATGIGAAIVERFATLGAGVACCYHNSRASAETLAAKLQGRGLEVYLVQADVARQHEVKAAIEATIGHFGRPISVLVNNAGDSVNPAAVETMDETLWSQVIGINLTGPFLCAKHCIPGMKTLGSGRIINISSISARTGGGPGSVHYVASKAGLEGFTRALAKEVAPFNITVNGIAPGIIQTSLLARMNPPERLEQLRQTVPLLRIGAAEDIARVVSFVASDDAAYITGEIIAVNGGMRMD